MQFKLDNVPRLTDGTGYRSWCSIATLYLRSRLLWRIVDGTETKPTDTALLEKWELQNISAQLLLTSMVDTSISHIVSEALTARDAWQALQDRFDRRNSTTLYTSVKSFFISMAMADGDSMLDHINGYETYLRQLIQRCKDTSTDDAYQHLANYLGDEKIKAHHLLMTLPDSMANVVDNLQSKSDLTYLDVRTRLLELASSSLVDTNKKNKALNVKGKGKSTQSTTSTTKPNPTRAGKTEPAKGNQCSWCKSRGHACDGHTFKTCQKLKDYQASINSSINHPSCPTPSTGKEVVPFRASTAQEIFKDNGLALIAVSQSAVSQSAVSQSAVSQSSANSSPPSGPVLATVNHSTYESVAMLASRLVVAE
jgi:hypothetical protein